MPSLWRFVLPFYLILNLILFILFYWDKRLARLQRRRVSEQTLLSLGLIGGMLGGLAGRQVFHHKTRKRYFGILYWLALLAHLAAWYGIWRWLSIA